ncbi:MAG: tetratricopeptide repeat protein [Pseudomonadota bacterium]
MPSEIEPLELTQDILAPERAFKQASAYVRAEAYASADEILAAAITAHTNDPNLLRMQGISLAHQKRFAEAEAKLTHAVRLAPEHGAAYEDLADVQLAQRALEPALKSLTSAIKHTPQPARIEQRLAQLLTAAGRNREAESVLETALQSDPRRQEIAEAMDLVNQRQFKQAEAIYRNILRKNPNDVDALRLLGVSRVKREHFDEAAACFRRAVELAPDFWKAWINLGAALSEQQKFEEAEQAYLKALELQPKSAFTLERMGVNALKASRLEKVHRLAGPIP